MECSNCGSMMQNAELKINNTTFSCFICNACGNVHVENYYFLQCCRPLTKMDIFESVFKEFFNIEGKDKEITFIVMKHLKGRCNPLIITPVVNKLKKDLL